MASKESKRVNTDLQAVLQMLSNDNLVTEDPSNAAYGKSVDLSKSKEHAFLRGSTTEQGLKQLIEVFLSTSSTFIHLRLMTESHSTISHERRIRYLRDGVEGGWIVEGGVSSPTLSVSFALVEVQARRSIPRYSAEDLRRGSKTRLAVD
jgi:hypothetical protein